MAYSDGSRDKIIIRPRCKEYAAKQRANGHTLACFTAMALYNEPSTDTSAAPPTTPSSQPATEKKSALLTPAERSAKLAKFFKLGSRSTNAAVYSGRIEKASAKSQLADVLIQSRINHPPAPAVAGKKNSGCEDFKKVTGTATPVKVLAAASGAENPSYPRPPPLLLPSAQYPCTCRDPKCCPRCRLLALADRYVHKNCIV